MTTAGPITLGSLGHEAQVAVRAVTEAMQVARSLEGRVTVAAARADTSPVTVADLAIQALIARRLADDFQDDPVLAEEDASWLRGEPRGSWTRTASSMRSRSRRSDTFWLDVSVRAPRRTPFTGRMWLRYGPVDTPSGRVPAAHRAL